MEKGHPPAPGPAPAPPGAPPNMPPPTMEILAA